MKKSEMYRESAKAVVLAEFITTSDKLEILRELFGKEELEKFIEEREAAENGEL